MQTIGDLQAKSESELKAIPNFGERSIEEVIEAMHGLGLDAPRRVGLQAAGRRRNRAMRHKRTRHKLSRDSAHRKSLMKNLSRQLIEHERIQTSQAKAKAVKPEVEKMITLAKRGDLHSRRLLLSRLGQDKFIVHKLVDEIAPRYSERPGGYTRIVKLGPRRSRFHRNGLSGTGLGGSPDGDLPARHPLRRPPLQRLGAAAGEADGPG